MRTLFARTCKRSEANYLSSIRKRKFSRPEKTSIWRHHQDLFTWSWRVRHTGGYLRDESPDRARGWQDVDVGITGVCGDRLPEHRAAAAAIQEQPLPEVGALG